MMSGAWRERRRWRWKRRGHITLLETEVVSAWIRESAEKDHGPRRLLGLADSRASLGSILKGRSASVALHAALQRSNACLLATGSQVAMCFAPTRLNVADDPTRLQEVRPAIRAPRGGRVAPRWCALSGLCRR